MQGINASQKSMKRINASQNTKSKKNIGDIGSSYTVS